MDIVLISALVFFICGILVGGKWIVECWQHIHRDDE